MRSGWEEDRRFEPARGCEAPLAMPCSPRSSGGTSARARARFFGRAPRVPAPRPGRRASDERSHRLRARKFAVLSAAVAGSAAGGISLQDLPVVTKPELMSCFDDWPTDRSVKLSTVSRFLDGPDPHRRVFSRQVHRMEEQWQHRRAGHLRAGRSALAIYDALLAVQMRSVQVASQYAWGLLAARRARRACGGDRRPLREHCVMAAGLPRNALAQRARVFRDGAAGRARCRAQRIPARVPCELSDDPCDAGVRAARGTPAQFPRPVYGPEANTCRSRKPCGYRARVRCRLINEYGASECLAIAHSCSQVTCTSMRIGWYSSPSIATTGRLRPANRRIPCS